MVLNEVQKSLALGLKDIRPPVIPGTNVIVNSEELLKYYVAVGAAINACGITGRGHAEFCDLAGIPD